MAAEGGGGVSELHPDHLRLLSLARAALTIRNDRQAWRGNTMRAAEAHGAACNELWEELERQVAINDGKVPVAELPIVKQRRMAAQMRSTIVNTALVAIEGAFKELENGPALEDYE
jgi:hypothetical protein